MSELPIEPIATYREQRFDGKRVFELFPDRVRIRGSVQLKSEFDTSVALNALVPTANYLTIRNMSFWHGCWILLGAVLVDTVLLTSLHVEPENSIITLFGCLGMAGVVVMLISLCKVKFA